MVEIAAFCKAFIGAKVEEISITQLPEMKFAGDAQKGVSYFITTIRRNYSELASIHYSYIFVRQQPLTLP